MAVAPARRMPLAAPVGEPRRYRPAQAIPTVVAGLAGATGTREGHGELGITALDVIGRTELVAMVAWAPRERFGPTGGRLAGRWRRGPVDLRGSLYGVSDGRFSARRAGLELQVGLEERFGGGVSASLRGGGLLEVPVDDADASGHRRVLFSEVAASLVDDRRDRWGLAGRFRLQGGLTGGDGFTLWDGRVAGRVLRVPALFVAYERAHTTGESPLDLLSVGSLPSSVLPEAATWAWAPDLRFAARTLVGARRDRLEGGLAAGPVSAVARRHRTGLSTLPSAYTTVGIEAGGTVEPQPFLRLASFDVIGGVSCILEDPRGWRERACRKVDDWGAYLGLTWSRR